MKAIRNGSPWIPLILGVLVFGVAASFWWSQSRISPEERLKRAATLMNAGETRAAADALDRLLRQDPENSQALLYRGQLAHDENDAKTALEYWRRIPDEAGRSAATARFLEGIVQLDRKQARLAEAAFQQVLRLKPDDLPARERLLALYVAQRRGKAIRRTLAAIRQVRDWTLAERVLHLAAWERIQTPEEGIQAMQAFCESDPDDVESRIALARYYADADQLDQATAILRDVNSNFPNARSVSGLLVELLLQDATAAALREAHRLLTEMQLGPQSTHWDWMGAGRYCLEVGAWEEASACYTEALRIVPDARTAEFQLGTALSRCGRRDEAAVHLERAKLLDRVQLQADLVMRADQRSPRLLLKALLELGELLEQLDRHAAAKDFFEQAVALAPQDRAAVRGLRRTQRAFRTEVDHVAISPPNRPEIAWNSERWTRVLRRTKPSGPAVHEDAPKAGAEANTKMRFRDVHAEVGLDFQYFNGQTGWKYLIETTGSGVAVLDYDRDGWPDLYFPQGCRLPFDAADREHTNCLYRNGMGRGFNEVAARARVDDNRYGVGCAAGDLDNDGFPDLVVANFGQNVIYHNNGDGTFTDVTSSIGLPDDLCTMSIALADWDGDGFLDAYFVNYVDPIRVCRAADGRIATCDPQNFAGVQDRIWWNAGDGSFVDHTESAGILAPGGKGLGVIVAHLDDDERPDIYVANDGTANFLFLNKTSSPGRVRFEEHGLLSGAALSGAGRAEAGMGIACADFNADSRLDLYVTNFYLESNTLYLNQGRGFFHDKTRSAGLEQPTLSVLGFGTQALDVDLDGDPDLFVANGHIDDFRFRGEPWAMPPQLFENVESGRFADVSVRAGEYFQGQWLGRGVARLDWNRDGRPDLVVVHQDRTAALLSNETQTDSRSLTIDLYGVESNRDGIGVRLRITTTEGEQTAEVIGGHGFCVSNERRQQIGLGKSTHTDRLEILWPSGQRQVLTSLPPDRPVTAIEQSTSNGGREPIPLTP